MATRHESVSGSSCVYVHSGLRAQPQGHIRTHTPAQGTFSTGSGAVTLPWFLHSMRSLAPVVASVDMAAGEVDPGLTLLKAAATHQVINIGSSYSYVCMCITKYTPPVAARQAGESQCAEAYRTLGPGRIKFLAKCLQMAQSGGAHEPLTCAPQQGGAAQIHQRTVTQSAALALCLRAADRHKSKSYVLKPAVYGHYSQTSSNSPVCPGWVRSAFPAVHKHLRTQRSPSTDPAWGPLGNPPGASLTPRWLSGHPCAHQDFSIWLLSPEGRGH